MEISLKHIGSYGGKPATSIEMKVQGWASEIVEDVTDMKGRVDEELIGNLREIADELEEQNQKLKEKGSLQ